MDNATSGRTGVDSRGGRVTAARLVAAIGVVACAASIATLASASDTADFAAASWNVLPPGQAGGVAFTPNSTDQATLYDALTPLRDQVTAATIAKTFKPAPLGLGREKAVSTERPRKGLTITRDRWGVPHVVGVRDVDVAFGAGWATAQDRQLIMELLRGPGRLAALDAPGVDAFSLALQGKTFLPSAATEQRLGAQFTLLARTAKGRRIVRLIDAYVAGINAWYRKAGLPIQPWRRADVVGVAGLIGGIFGNGGGDEARRSTFLAELQQQLGAERGRQAWEDLRLRDDPEARTAVERPFPTPPSVSELGNVVLDPDSITGAATIAPAAKQQLSASNALLVGAQRSATKRPLAVMGPQVSYYYPEILLELDLRGGGYAARGAAFPGISFGILLGRGADFAWSATSAGLDLTDQYVETLCQGSDVRYLYRGECREMTAFDAGVVRGAPGTPDQRLVYRETVHGPVAGYATVEGRRVALTSKRSTRGRELLAAPFFTELSLGAVRSAKDFVRLAGTVELTFNWHYVDARDIAVFTSGRVPVRPTSVDSGLPTKGTGEFEWQGFLAADRHPQGVNPKAGAILNWNNKAARRFVASDSEWAHGSVQRVDLLWRAVQRRPTHTLASLVGAMNLAATQDLRAVRVWPTVTAVLASSAPPTARAGVARSLVDAWVERGGSRLDTDLDGRVDDPGAAVLDAAWKPLTDAVLRPVLGDLVGDLERLLVRDDAPARGGSAYLDGWYSYVDKDLRALLGRPVQGAFRTRFCGRGALAACATSLWQALDEAAVSLEQSAGLDPALWRADAAAERIRFAPGILPDTMRWTNRPTFQQVVSFRGRR
jgi:acyl-homoserine lactone acylase PvdQ